MNTVGDDGRGFELTGNARSERSMRGWSFLHVLRVNVFQRAETPALVVPTIHQPRAGNFIVPRSNRSWVTGLRLFG